jgi:hypothetical protein
MQVGHHCHLMVVNACTALGLPCRPVTWFRPQRVTGQVLRSAAGFRSGEAVYDTAQLVGRLSEVLHQVPPRRVGVFC